VRITGSVAPILILLAGVELDVGGSPAARPQVTAWENSQVTARENSQVTARENSQVTAWGNSQVTARENSQVTARENSQVTARENSQVTARENSQVTARENSQVTAWGNSQVTARENSQVTARENSQVTARENSQVTARENSQVTARGNSQVTAWGYAFVRAFSARRITASPLCIIARHAGNIVVEGGQVLECPAPATPPAWCDFYGVTVVAGVATLYKAVNADGRSPHGCDYSPGLTPVAPDWDGGERECGGGLHFSPHPIMALEFHTSAKRFMACPVALDDIVVHPNGSYPEKVKARGCVGPTVECDRDGKVLV
jgi:hypothetical protein